MTDHRVTNVPLGHLGEASYNPDDKEWRFSKDVDTNWRLQQVLPFTQCIAPSNSNIHEKESDHPLTIRSQLKFLSKNYAETFPGNELIFTELQESPQASLKSAPIIGTLLALGQAWSSGASRTVPIIAMPCGEAGTTLRLVRPRIERYTWDTKSGIQPKLSLMNPGSSEQGYWAGNGGPIQQIIFSNAETGSANLFAIRQPHGTTVLQAIYQLDNLQSTPLKAEPLVILSVEKTNSTSHVDVSFNPWYSRQISLIDNLGRWSIYDIEGGKANKKKAVLSRSGKIYDITTSKSTFMVPDSANGWHRVLWIGSVNTLAVCSRRSLVLYDVTTEKIESNNMDIMASYKHDCILDMKRSTANHNQLFILTSSQLIWLEVSVEIETIHTETIKQERNKFSVRTILSSYHFRDKSDETMSLTVCDHKNATVFISSKKDSINSFYRFRGTSEWSINSTFSEATLILARNYEDHAKSGTEMGSVTSQQDVCIFPAPLLLNTPEGDDGEDIRESSDTTQFYQALALSSTLELLSTAFETRLAHDRSPSKIFDLDRATKARPLKVYKSARYIIDSFVVPDGVDDIVRFEGLDTHLGLETEHSANLLKVRDLQLRIDWSQLFEMAFRPHGQTINYLQQNKTRKESENIVDLVERISSKIDQGGQQNGLILSTLLDLSNLGNISEDFDKSSTALMFFVESLIHDQPNDDNNLFLSLFNLASYEATELLSGQTSSAPDLLKVYDELVHSWITGLPSGTPSAVRLAKFKTICKVAIEIFLASTAVSHTRLTDLPGTPPENSQLGHPSSRYSTPAARSYDGSTQDVPPVSGIDILLENRANRSTSSIRASSYSQEQFKGDDEAVVISALARLQQYSKLNENSESIAKWPYISQWSSSPGHDPSEYSWEKEKLLSSVEDDDKSLGKRHSRRASRRKRQVEKALFDSRTSRENSTIVVDTRNIGSFSSQPVGTNKIFSSQIVEDVPMTQPLRGEHGTRLAYRAGKTSKKQRAPGFR